MMTGEVGTSNGESMDEGLQCVKSEPANNGLENNGSEGSSGVRTYKRRKHATSGWEYRMCEDVRISVEGAGKSADQTVKEPWDHLQRSRTLNGSNDVSRRQWRKFVLEHMCQSLSDEDGGLRGCIQDALMMTESDICDEERCKSTSQVGCTSNGSDYAAKGHASVMSNGALDESHHRTVTDICQRAFLKILLSEKFTLLSKLLFENFQGLKADRLLSLSHMNRRMKQGAYEHSPMLFYEDVDQFWGKLLEFGTELISLTKSLLDTSKFFYNKQLGGSIHCKVEDGKPEFCTQESNSHGKPQQTEGCCVYRMCACRHCGDKADGRDCLVCDSCEDIYHISCIKPAVKEVPPRSWYCTHCTANGMRSPHNNCVVCERMNASQTPFDPLGCELGSRNAAQSAPLNQAGCEIGSRDEGNFKESAETSNYNTDDGVQLSEGSKSSVCVCKVCGNTVQDGEKVKICDHSVCPNKYYHVRCLTSKQVKSYGPRWYCPSCLCRGCLTDKDDDKIVLCDGCDHAYHLYCVIPPLTTIPRGKWFCRQCHVKIQEIRRVRRAYEQYARNQLNKKGEGVTMENERQPKERGEVVKSAYEKYANQMKERGEGVKSACDSLPKGDRFKREYENLNKLTNSGEQSYKGREGMEILVSAALQL